MFSRQRIEEERRAFEAEEERRRKLLLEKEEEERRRLASEEVAVLYYNLLSLIYFFLQFWQMFVFIWFSRWPRSRLRGRSSREQSLQQPGSLDHHYPRCHHCDHHHYPRCHHCDHNDHHLVCCRAVEKKRKTGSERSSPAVWAAVKVNMKIYNKHDDDD